MAVYYGNRSFAHLKMESYGYALSDATTALELDKSYIKVQWDGGREAVTPVMLLRFEIRLNP